MAALPPEYRHEPAIALAGGASGFEPAERILRGALSRLTPDGCVFVEVGAGAEAFAAAHPRLPLIVARVRARRRRGIRADGGRARGIPSAALGAHDYGS